MTDRLQFDAALLAEVGLAGLPEADRTSLLAVLATELEMRVGGVIAGVLSEQQMEAFEQLMESGDEDGCRALLSTAVPGYQDFAHEEYTKLVAELRQRASQILAERTGGGNG